MYRRRHCGLVMWYNFIMYIIFTLVVLAATIIGAIFGIGGGVIIKPALEAVSGEPLSVINALSGLTVLSMAALSTLRYVRGGLKLNAEIVGLSCGAVAGGFAGKHFFNIFVSLIPEKSAKTIQCVILILIFIIITQKNRFRVYSIKNVPALAGAGLFMGAISAFLGIGGGPLNILVICVVIGVEAKQAAVYSIFTVLCSQAASFLVSVATNGYAGHDMSPLLVMIPASVAGGLIGPVIHRKLNAERFERYFNMLLWFLAVLNVYNIVKINM